ncbi:MAG: lamin tail domain-containing protein, partial [Muribaculaceae bacterium]|nr:lamin tail domain-containing protein [Muribaculaceae bacterium]
MRSKYHLLTSALIMASPAAMAELRITEIMQSNISGYYDDLGNYPDSWVEIYNDGTSAVDLSAYSVGIKKNADKAYTLPRQTLPGGQYIIVMCDKEETGFHTSFRLESNKAGRVILFRDGVGIDTVAHPAQPAPDIAYG